MAASEFRKKIESTSKTVYEMICHENFSDIISIVTAILRFFKR